MKEPFPLDIPESEMEKVRRNRYFALSPEEENSLEEFAWAFGSDAVREIEKQVKSIVEQIHGIPDLEQLSQAGLEEKLQYWHSLGPLDEDELLRRLELHIDDFPDELKENSALAVRLIERRRRVLRDRILREHPNIREHLKEKRNILEQRLQKQNPDGMQKLHNLENQNRKKRQFIKNKSKVWIMISLNDYLYSGDTVLKILKKYTRDLKNSAEKNQNEVDRLHAVFLKRTSDLLEHNDFLTAQSQKIREFYKYMAKEYAHLSFTFKGRIKSLIRAETKFNGYIVEYIYDYYTGQGEYPSLEELKKKLNGFRDLIAYRIVISMPKCHIADDKEREKEEIRNLYAIANVMKDFLEDRGFRAEPAFGVKESTSPLLSDAVRPYYRDYICHAKRDGYRSLHINIF